MRFTVKALVLIRQIPQCLNILLPWCLHSLLPRFLTLSVQHQCDTRMYAQMLVPHKNTLICKHPLTALADQIFLVIIKFHYSIRKNIHYRKHML